jgi:hypothetical protein
MEYYKELYEHSREQVQTDAKCKGRALGNIFIAEAILSAMDAFMDPDHFGEAN